MPKYTDRAKASSQVHVTRVSAAGDVYGHTLDKCDPTGCAGDELYFSDLHDCERGDVVDLPADGESEVR